MKVERYMCQQCGTQIGFEGLCSDCRAENARNEILASSPAEIDGLVEQICAEINETGKLEKNEALFRRLVNYRDVDTRKIAEIAFEKKIFHPFELYKDAPDFIIENMLKMLYQEDIPRIQAILILQCLAVHGDEDVFQAFLELEKVKSLRRKIKTSPVTYTTIGGWTYDQDKQYRKLIFDKCFPIVQGTSEEKKLSPVKIGSKADEYCPHCNCQMINLIELDGRDARLDFLGIDGIIKVKYCLECLFYYDNDFYKYTLDGKSEPIDEAFSQPNDPVSANSTAAIPSNNYILGSTPVPLRYAANWEGGSSVGGFPFWVQDAEICHCPECGKAMHYLAQIQWDTIIDYMEGNAYIEICKDCQIVTVLHQQT
jgi:hypothetical protein